MLSRSLISISNARPLDTSQSSPPSHRATHLQALFTIIIITPTCATSRTAVTARAANSTVRPRTLPADFFFFFLRWERRTLASRPVRTALMWLSRAHTHSPGLSQQKQRRNQRRYGHQCQHQKTEPVPACPGASKPSRSTSSRKRMRPLAGSFLSMVSPNCTFLVQKCVCISYLV